MIRILRSQRDRLLQYNHLHPERLLHHFSPSRLNGYRDLELGFRHSSTLHDRPLGTSQPFALHFPLPVPDTAVDWLLLLDRTKQPDIKNTRRHGDDGNVPLRGFLLAGRRTSSFYLFRRSIPGASERSWHVLGHRYDMVLQLHIVIHLAQSFDHLQATGSLWLVCRLVHDFVGAHLVVCARNQGKNDILRLIFCSCFFPLTQATPTALLPKQTRLTQKLRCASGPHPGRTGSGLLGLNQEARELPTQERHLALPPLGPETGPGTPPAVLPPE